MRSEVITEPASHEDIFIVERSDQIEEQGNTFTFYRGTFVPSCPAWKASRSLAVSSREISTSDTAVDSIGMLLTTKLAAIAGIERIFIRRDTDFFRVWVVIPDIDLGLEDEIYAAQLDFMDKFPEIPFDFAVIFRQGKDPDSIRPFGASLVHTCR